MILHLNARPLLMENGWHLMPVLITSIKALQINFLIIQKFLLMSVKINVLMTTCLSSIASRSGLAVRSDIEVGAGIIDEDYRGELKVLLRNFSDVPFSAERGDAIAQLIITPYIQYTARFVADVNDLRGNTVRGTGGFGSTS
jgi:deoxyuridine 5'-triphosphate nucleotidohydrolase